MSIDLKEFIASHPAPQGLSEETWATLASVMSKSSLFDSRTERIKLYARLMEMTGEVMTNAKKTLPDGRTVSKTQGKSDWVSKAREFMISEGIIGAEAVGKSYHNDVKRTGSLARLRLVFDVAVRSALAKGAWEKAISPSELEENPAYRFVRFPGAKIKRKVHEENENVVRLKTDYKFWADEMNSPEIGGFKLPWGPFGFNSYMYQHPVSREECEKIGLLKPGKNVQDTSGANRFGIDLPERYGAEKKVSVKDVPEELKERLREQMRQMFGADAIDQDGNVAFPIEEAAKRAREEAAKVTRDIREGLALIQLVSKVSDKMDIQPERTGIVDAVNEVPKVIDSVHKDGPLNKIPVYPKSVPEMRGEMNAAFVRYKDLSNNSGDKIGVRSTGLTPMISTTHEIGHFIDLRGMPGESFGSHSELFKGFFEAFDKTDTKQRIIDLMRRNPINIPWGNYALKREEVFARAYSQYIMEKSQNAVMLKEYEALRNDPKIFFDLWDHDEFKPLMHEIDLIFKQLKWI